MKKSFFKLLLLFVIVSLPGIEASGSYFVDQDIVAGNTVSTGCWVAPTIPQLIYPDNGYLANLGSDWLANPYMDWSDSSTTCPGGVISYEYESYHDAGLTNLAYRSGLLSNSMIPAPGTPDGTYYWRVRAFDGTNWSDWSEVWLLTVDRSIPPPSLGSANSPLGTPATSPPFSTAIVINEILPDPVGADVPMTNDEWVELYNRSDSEVDVAGWYLYDAIDSHALPILGTRTNTGDTKIPAHGFLVVYQAGDSDFSLDQDAGGDTVRLYDSSILTGTLIDSHTYTGPVAEGKSIARYPDGTDTWYDPIPTPGGPNKLESEEENTQEETQLEEPAKENSEVVPEDEVVTEEVNEPTASQSEGEQEEEDKEQLDENQDVKQEEEQAVESEDNSENSDGQDQPPADEPQEEPQVEESPQEEAPSEPTGEINE